MKRNRFWILLFAGLLAVLICAALVLRSRHSGRIANVYQDNVCIRSIDLSTVTSPYRFTVTDGDGHENVVLVEPGRIRVESANCPDQICVHTGWISDSVKPIVCLPARLTIRLERTAESGGQEIDGVVG